MVVAVVALAIACFILAVKALQTFIVWRFLQRPAREPQKPLPAFSILKPLCGLDDGLEQNLESFAALRGVTCEVLLGLKSPEDPALPLARRFEARYPDRFRVVFQEGAPGLNPKVNQLVTLARAAQHDLLVVSDASVRVGPGYLPEIAAWFEDDQVGLVTHSVAGSGERNLGALCDNIYLTTHFSSGLISAKAVSGQDMVLGKSMTFRRADLAAMGGFEAAKDHLAEDFYLGRWVGAVLGKQVIIARNVPQSVCVQRSVGDYVRRYSRWAVLQRHGVGNALYAVQVLTLYPIIPATVGLLAAPSRGTFAAWAGILAFKSLLDLTQMRLFREGNFSLRSAALVPFNDLLIGWAWFHGLRYDRVEWRGNWFQIYKDTMLVPPSSASTEATEEEARQRAIVR